jgi:hypothetical protein
MSAHDGAVDHGVFVVGLLGQQLKDPLPDACLCPTAEAAMHVLPVAETLWQVTPGDASAIAEEDGLDEQAVVGRGYPTAARAAG